MWPLIILWPCELFCGQVSFILWPYIILWPWVLILWCCVSHLVASSYLSHGHTIYFLTTCYLMAKHNSLIRLKKFMATHYYSMAKKMYSHALSHSHVLSCGHKYISWPCDSYLVTLSYLSCGLTLFFLRPHIIYHDRMLLSHCQAFLWPCVIYLIW